jgi:cytochrome c peroxidase
VSRLVSERACFAITWMTALMALAAPVRAGDFDWRLPPGFPQPAVPADNPMSEAKVALGAALFADSRLSVSGKHSCQSCHDPARAFTDGLARSRGASGHTLSLNAPTLINVAYNASYGWQDPRVRTLEQQMLGPLFHPLELGLAGREAVVERELAADADTLRGFRAAFPRDQDPVTLANVIRAIAAFERTLIAGGSDFDRYVFRGEHDALDANQKHGMALFFSKAGCSACHGGINFSGPWVDRDHGGAEPVFADTGTGVAVRVPTLRNLGATAPYLHDGRLATVEQVLEHYERLAADSGADPRLRRAPLTTGERLALREFLRSLDDQLPVPQLR